MILIIVCVRVRVCCACVCVYVCVCVCVLCMCVYGCIVYMCMRLTVTVFGSTIVIYEWPSASMYIPQASRTFYTLQCTGMLNYCLYCLV